MPANREMLWGQGEQPGVMQAATAGARWLAEKTVSVVTRPIDMSEDQVRDLPVQVIQEDPLRYADEAQRALGRGEKDLAKLTVELALRSLADARDHGEVPAEVKAHLGERVWEAVELVKPTLPEGEELALPPLADGLQPETAEEVVDEVIWNSAERLGYQ